MKDSSAARCEKLKKNAETTQKAIGIMVKNGPGVWPHTAGARLKTMLIMI